MRRMSALLRVSMRHEQLSPEDRQRFRDVEESVKENHYGIDAFLEVLREDSPTTGTQHRVNLEELHASAIELREMARSQLQSIEGLEDLLEMGVTTKSDFD